MPSSARTAVPYARACCRMPGSVTAIRIAWARRSAVSFFCGMGSGPRPSALIRAPQKGWSRIKGTITEGTTRAQGFGGGARAAVMHQSRHAGEQPVMGGRIQQEDILRDRPGPQTAPTGEQESPPAAPGEGLKDQPRQAVPGCGPAMLPNPT